MNDSLEIKKKTADAGVIRHRHCFNEFNPAYQNKKYSFLIIKQNYAMVQISKGVETVLYSSTPVKMLRTLRFW